MSYTVKNPSAWGQLGQGLGKGLEEQFKEDYQRGRMKKGLEELGQEAPNLNPFQILGRASTVPGATPELVRSYADLAKNAAKGKALADFNQKEQIPKPSPFAKSASAKSSRGSEIPSLTTEKTAEEAQNGYIPPTYNEILEHAGQMYEANPALFENNPQKAIDAAQISADQDRLVNEAYQRKHQNLSDIQDKVVNRLQNHSQRLGVDIPSNVYSKIEDKSIQATKPKSQGGDGLTEQQAIKKYGDELDAISRDYKEIDSIGNWGITGRPAKNTLTRFKALQSKFEKRGDTENFADELIARNNLSPGMAYSIAQPVSKVPEINGVLNKLPNYEIKLSSEEIPVEHLRNATQKVSERIAPLLGKNDKAGPLAIAHELDRKGYDANQFLEYLIDHRDELNLTDKQGRQLDKQRNIIPTLNDWWLSAWSGIGG